MSWVFSGRDWERHEQRPESREPQGAFWEWRMDQFDCWGTGFILWARKTGVGPSWEGPGKLVKEFELPVLFTEQTRGT